MGKYEKPRKLKKIADEHPCLAVCAGKHCAKAGTKYILRAAQAALNECGLQDEVTIALTKCQDYCDDGPVVTVLPGEYPYVDLTPQGVTQVVREHLAEDQPVLPLLHKRTRKRLQAQAA